MVNIMLTQAHPAVLTGRRGGDLRLVRQNRISIRRRYSQPEVSTAIFWAPESPAMRGSLQAVGSEAAPDSSARERTSRPFGSGHERRRLKLAGLGQVGLGGRPNPSANSMQCAYMSTPIAVASWSTWVGPCLAPRGRPGIHGVRRGQSPTSARSGAPVNGAPQTIRQGPGRLFARAADAEDAEDGECRDAPDHVLAQRHAGHHSGPVFEDDVQRRQATHG